MSTNGNSSSLPSRASCGVIGSRGTSALHAGDLRKYSGHIAWIGRSCYDNVFTIKQTIKKRREFNFETHIAFLDLEKAFDRVNRNQQWQILDKRGIPYHLIEVIKSLYKIPVYKLTQEGKFLTIYIYIYIYILIKEYDKVVICHRLFLIFTQTTSKKLETQSWRWYNA